MKHNFSEIILALQRKADKKQALILQKFFKTGPGEYGEGDIFWGIRVPDVRNIGKQYSDLSYNSISRLLNSKVHEQRLLGIIILVLRYQQSRNFNDKQEIVDFYLQNLERVNNWDLVDISAYKILGNFMYHYWNKAQTRKYLLILAADNNVWLRRIAVVSTLYFIQKGRSVELFYLLNKLNNDKHDLIHKAMGWMLRELGKKIDQKILIKFLDINTINLPRTTLRYAIEHLSPSLRVKYLKMN